MRQIPFVFVLALGACTQPEERADPRIVQTNIVTNTVTNTNTEIVTLEVPVEEPNDTNPTTDDISSQREICVEWEREESLSIFVWNWTKGIGTWPTPENGFETCAPSNDSLVCCELTGEAGDLFQVNGDYFADENQRWIATFVDPFPDDDGNLDEGAWDAGTLSVDGDEFPFDTPVNGLPLFDANTDPADVAVHEGGGKLYEQYWVSDGDPANGVGFFGRLQ